MLLSPQMQERGYYELATSTDPHVGTRPYTGMWQRFSRTPGNIRHAAPLLGEHNEWVFGELLGITKDELEKLAGDGVIATAPENPDNYVLARVKLADMEKAGLLRHYDDDYKQMFAAKLGWHLG
jgi:hypothetical protein